jgi:hypothetical protein
MSRRLIITTAVLLAFGSVGAAVQAQPQSQKPAPACFLSRDWRGWKPTPDSRAIYVRVGVSQVYRLDFSSACPILQRPDAHLITKIRGSDWICSPLDLDLEVSDAPGVRVPCIVKGITPLSRDQAAALPKDQRP